MARSASAHSLARGALTVGLVVAAFAGGALLNPRPSDAQSMNETKPLSFEHCPTNVDLHVAYGALTESERTQLTRRLTCYRAKVPGGWLVMNQSSGLTFMPDPNHQWAGGTLR